jgi:hypothetical protein
VWGVVVSYRIHPWLAGLMALLLTVISGLVAYTAHVIRRERKIESTQAKSGSAAFKQRQQ